MTNIYRVWLNRGPRAKTELGLFTSEEVANYVASTTELRDGQTVSVEAVAVNDAGNVDQYVSDERLARIRELLSPEELELLRKRAGVI